MGAIERAMAVAADSAKVYEDSLNGLVDKKEKQLAKSKAINHARDILEQARNDKDGGGAKNFTTSEKAAVTNAAAQAGVSLTNDKDFAEFEGVHSEGSNAWLESSDEEAQWDDDRNENLDAVDKKLERALQETQDGTGMIDFKMNLAMNDLSKSMQDAQAVNQVRSQLLNALIPRA